MSDIQILKELLQVEPLPARDENNRIKKWPQVEKLIDSSEHDVEGATNVTKLQQYLIAAITALPEKGQLRLRKQTVKLAGQVFTHLVLNGNTYVDKKKAIRQAIKDHFFDGDFKAGEDFLRAPDVKFDDSERTKRVNAVGEEKSEKRQDNAVVISAERVEKIVEQMKADLDSGYSEYNVVAVLLGDLCLGSRWVESLMFSKFDVDKKETITGRNKIPTKWVSQTGISKKFNRGVDNRKMSVYKPCLPYIDADYLVEKINAFRSANAGLKQHLLNYDSNNKDDVRLANRFRAKANKLIQKRYLTDILSRAENKKASSDQRAASSHLLRAIWVNLSYELFHKKGQAKDKYVKDTLGHDSYSPGVRYKDVMIVPADEDAALENLSFGTVNKAELEPKEDEIDAMPEPDDMDDSNSLLENEPEPEQEPEPPKPVAKPKEDKDEISNLKTEMKGMRADMKAMRDEIKNLTSLLQKFVLNTAMASVPKQAPREDNLEDEVDNKPLRRSARLKK